MVPMDGAVVVNDDDDALWIFIHFCQLVWHGCICCFSRQYWCAAVVDVFAVVH